MLILPVKGLNQRCQSVPPLHPCLNKAVSPGFHTLRLNLLNASTYKGAHCLLPRYFLHH